MIKFLDLQAITQMHGEEIKAAVNRVIDSGWFLQGSENQNFESHYAQYIGCQHCVAVANGLDALRLILRAYKEIGILREGDEVIVPANTYIATILAITDNNLVPVLVEPDIETLQIDDTLIEQAITPRTRAVMIVHLYGRCAYTERIADICQRHHLRLIEDNAQASGCNHQSSIFNLSLRQPNLQSSIFNLSLRQPNLQSSIFNLQSKKTGSLGDAAAHSFYPGKNLGALGDAGAVTTDDAELASVVRALANYGSQQKYVFRYQGINSRMAETDAAVLDVKLRYLDEDNRRRQQLAAYYYDNIRHPLVHLPRRVADEENVCHLFPVFCERRDELQAWLAEQGIQTLIHYPIPPHRQACYPDWNTRSLPITEHIHACELSLPIHQALSMDEAREVVRAVNAFR